ncbi:hypothetical protein COLO4_27964 [Corchorus olitorius]|uniref:Uncharacterized protein n=1 Tax=Corchorus olitorius TaxID=93759 RepID=A0A1R3HNR4_9ROSI|nr:hypothetical protein COLO4_27964 [Corchorus olitorius]
MITPDTRQVDKRRGKEVKAELIAEEEERGLLLLKRVEKDGELGFDVGEEELGENQLIDVNVDREGESKRDKEEDGERHEMEGVGFEYAVGYVSNGPKIDF